jgi:dolichyl-phosphate-mannose--protein O-mannosyl transferase
LLLLRPFHSFALVTGVQHLMGLGTAVMIYLLLRRRFGLPGWGATLAAVPIMFDSYQIQLEQLILSDAPFIFLIVAAITVLLWRDRPSWRAGAAAGGLLSLAALTRSLGLAVIVAAVGCVPSARSWPPRHSR